MGNDFELVNLLSKHPELLRHLNRIKEFTREIWGNTVLPWFTNHDHKHSEEIIYLLDQVVRPLERTPHALNEHELFILLSATYLHDIGMQHLKGTGKTIDSLDQEDHEFVRKWHAEESYKIIISRFSTLDRDDYHFPDIDEQYIPAIAKVAKGHGTDFFDDVINGFKKNPETPKGREVRCELLTALLLVGDELDLQGKRVDFKRLSQFTPSDYSLTHWYKHHYVDFVNIEKGVVQITLNFQMMQKSTVN